MILNERSDWGNPGTSVSSTLNKALPAGLSHKSWSTTTKSSYGRPLEVGVMIPLFPLHENKLIAIRATDKYNKYFFMLIGIMFFTNLQNNCRFKSCCATNYVNIISVLLVLQSITYHRLQIYLLLWKLLLL
ncbi:hypothetical protein SDC9_110531 [bioreactor metagenome]|uniref:Uncharacterized protein n=1 Tax=bioreactor metagenome TaxID=1076179 RepID=A0A645BDW0_9ZZZZ